MRLVDEQGRETDRASLPESPAAISPRPNLAVLAGAAALIAAGAFFRVWRLSSVPGVSGDEGWWGIQALAWLSGQAYETNTTSGNPIDLFLLIPVGLVHLIAPPSFATLRYFPALANLLALPLAFVMVRKTYGATTAALQTVALAVLPTAIAHSRICQDPSQTVFWTGVVIYSSLMALTVRRRPWVPFGVALLTFPIALWTHPTNVFISPFLLLPISRLVQPLLPVSPRARAALLIGGIVCLAAVPLAALQALRAFAGWNEYVHKPWFAMATERLTDGALWFEFAANNARLFNGVTIYHYFSGARPWTVPFDALFVLVVLAAMAGFLRARRESSAAVDAGLIAACAGTWLLFYAFAGPEALRPHFERWGLCLLVPGSLVITRGTARWIEQARVKWIPVGAAGTVAAALVATYYVNYFAEFAASGGRSHLTYVTAAMEPKAQAVAAVIQKRSGTEPVTIVASQWWLERPVRYLASAYPNLQVVRDFPQENAPPRSGRLFAIEFVGTPELDQALTWMRMRGLAVDITHIDAADGRPLLVVLGEKGRVGGPSAVTTVLNDQLSR